MSAINGNGLLPGGKLPAKPRPAVKLLGHHIEDDANDASGAAMQVIVVDGADDADTLRGHIPEATVMTFDVLLHSNADEVESLVEDRSVLVLVPGDARPATIARAMAARSRFGDVSYESHVVSWPAWTVGTPFGFPGGLETVGSRLAWMRSLPEVETPAGTQTAPPPFSLDLIGTAAFFAETYRLDWLAKGILVADQMGVIGGPSKSLKTSILIDLAISLASGSPFLGRFPIPEPMPVALISGESGRAVIQANAKRVCESKGIPYEAAGKVSWGFALPALTNAEHLAVLSKAIKDGGFKVLMVDPLYMSLLAGNVEVDAKNMYSMGPILDVVARTCLDEGCTPIVAHHFVKKREDPYGPAVLDDLAFSGIGQFVRQWMLLSRRERYDPESGVHKFTFTYGGSAGHAGEMHLDIDTGQITEDLDRGRKWSVLVSTPSEGRAAREEQEREKREAKEAEKALLADQRAEQALLTNVGKVVEAIRAINKGGQVGTVGRIREVANLNNEKARAAVARAAIDGRIELYTAKVSNGTGSRQVEAYRLVVPTGRTKS